MENVRGKVIFENPFSVWNAERVKPSPMSRNIEKLQPDTCYYIHNGGNNSETVFFRRSNYRYFLQLFEKYILPVSEVYAWCLTPNEFHFLLRTKSHEEMRKSVRSYATVTEVKTLGASYQFSHLLNSYSQAVNRQMRRTGCLFAKPFGRKIISSDAEFQSCLSHLQKMAKHSDYGYHSMDTSIKTKSTPPAKPSTS